MRAHFSLRRLLLIAFVVGGLANSVSALASPSHAASVRSGEVSYPAGVSARPIGVHSMLHLNTPFAAKRAMFQQAAAMGASEIRLDIELSSVFPSPAPPRSRPHDPLAGLPLIGHPTPAARKDAPTAAPAWSGVDEYMELAQRYHLRVLADLTSTPHHMADCPSGTPERETYRCPADPVQWAAAAGAIAAHTRGVIDDFEIINEPNGRWAFLGSPAQYAVMLSDAYRAIHANDPAAQVVLGGIMNPNSTGLAWMNAMLATAGVDALHSFDVANVHVRGAVSQAGSEVCEWRSYLAREKFAGPLWVTETGYPASPASQSQPGFRDGAAAQVRWLDDAVPAMLVAGSAKVFVTERDWGPRPFSSEGVLRTPDPLPASVAPKRRASFYAVQRLAREGRTAIVRAFMHRSGDTGPQARFAGAACVPDPSRNGTLRGGRGVRPKG
ncbi:MAG: hypothetical protein M3N46_13035 [Actinomycetota bacterium]|nr:hypothetical protein [Actinomycetota bacterium]